MCIQPRRVDRRSSHGGLAKTCRDSSAAHTSRILDDQSDQVNSDNLKKNKTDKNTLKISQSCWMPSRGDWRQLLGVLMTH